MTTKLLTDKLKGLIWSGRNAEEEYYQDNYLSYATLTVDDDDLDNKDDSRHTHSRRASWRDSYQQQQQQQQQQDETDIIVVPDTTFDYSHQTDPAHGTSSMLVATFNLVATIVGGGVLSVPFAFAKCGGALWGVLWMTLAAGLTDQSCLMLCWCARPPEVVLSTTAIHPDVLPVLPTTPQLLSSYGQVGKAAFGPLLEVAISAVIFVFLVFVLIAYMVLVKDIWTPLWLALYEYAYAAAATTWLPSTKTTASESTTMLGLPEEARRDDIIYGPYVLLGIIVFMSPFLVQRTLHALRFNCYIGFASVSILCLALCHHALSSSSSTNNNNNNVLWTRDFWLAPPESVQDVLVAFPILMLSFLCHFNVNPIQKALIRPTPQRVRGVVRGAMMACGLLMTLFGVAGYAYVVGGNNTATSTVVQGNILLNCEDEQQAASRGGERRDLFLLLGRVGCGITIMLAMAIMILPCRDSLLEVLDIIAFASTSTDTTASPNHNNHGSHQTDSTLSETTPLVGQVNDNDKTLTAAGKPMATNHHVKPPSLSEVPAVHYGSTLLIVVVCYVSAVKAPGVAIVWSLCGSSMAFCIAFMLPTACFLQILHQREQQQQHDDGHHPGGPSSRPSQSTPSKGLAWVLLVTSVVAAIVCTTQTIESMV